MLPFPMIVPIPVNVLPSQQKLYRPFSVPDVMKSTALLQLSESSSKRPSNTVNVKLQDVVLLEASLAVHVTVVVPTGKLVPVGGEQPTFMGVQFPVTVGGG